jgi:hypothetical protein
MDEELHRSKAGQLLIPSGQMDLHDPAARRDESRSRGTRPLSHHAETQVRPERRPQRVEILVVESVVSERVTPLHGRAVQCLELLECGVACRHLEAQAFTDRALDVLPVIPARLSP